MFSAITHSGIFVLDQDEALAFYVGKLGLEVAQDVDMGFMRWLTVKAPGDTREILLETPNPAFIGQASVDEIRGLVTKGAMGLAFILVTEDCRATYETLKARGVEFTQEPTEHFYGIDCGLRDPFGNQLRFSQLASGPVEVPTSL